MHGFAVSQSGCLSPVSTLVSERFCPFIPSNLLKLDGSEISQLIEKIKSIGCISPKTKGSVYLIAFGNFTNLFK